MAAAYRAQASRLNSATAVTSFTLTLDAATGAGDICLIAFEVDAGISTISGLGATWSRVQQGNVSTDNTELWQGIGCTSGNTTITVTLTASDRVAAMAVAISGATAVLSTAKSTATASAGVAVAPTQTATAGGQAVVDFFIVNGGFLTVSYTDTPAAFTTVHAATGSAWYSAGWASAYRITTGVGSHSRTLTTGTGSNQAAVTYSALVGTSSPTVSLTGATTDEETLAGALTVRTYQYLTADTRQETVLAATLSVAGSYHAAITAEHTLAGALTVSTPMSAWIGDDTERMDLPFELEGILDIEPVEVPPPATDPYIQRVSITMPTPTLVNGRPDATWTPTVARSDWGRLQLIVGSVDLSRPRGMGFLPLNDAHTDPFGDAEAAFALPGITEFDDPAAWGLTALAPVRLRRKDPSGVFHTLYEGSLASLEQYTLPDGSDCLSIQCVGALYRLDLLKEPPRLLTTAHDYGDIIPWAFNDKRRRYFTNTGVMRHVNTGVQGVRNADFQPFLTGMTQDYLAELQTQGAEYTVMLNRPRTPVLMTRDTTTVHATVSYGAQGVDVKLSKDFTTATTAVYGSGTNGHCTWMGARFPNLTEGSAPTFPLTVGSVFSPGDGQGGFAPFAAYLRSGQYGTIESDDTYLSSDVDSVEQFQDRANITVDGVVGAQTWEAAFQPGANQGSMSGAYVDTIYEKAATRNRIYNAQGADVGPNPVFDPNVPRIEDYVPFGDNVSKKLGRTSAKQIIARNYPAGRVGTVTLTSDPAEMSRYDLAAGMNLKVTNYAGGFVLVHITRRVRDWQTGTVTLTVDEKHRDLLTAASIHQRNKDVSDLTRRQRFGRQKSKVFNDYGAWLCEDGAGHIPLMNQQGGFWNIQRIAAAPKGSIERISLALGSGLTQHLVNQTVSNQPPSSIPGAARGCIALFTQPISANGLSGLPGLGTPITNLADGTNPWDRNNTTLVNNYGMIYAAGGPGSAIGFYPNNDPGDGSSTHLSGLFEDGGSIQFGPTGHYWLWVAIWTSTSCKVGGQIFPGAPS